MALVRMKADDYIRSMAPYEDLEILIFEDGLVARALPSHQLSLLRLCMEKYKLTTENMWNKIPQDCDVLNWMVRELGCVSVWPVGYYRPKILTDRQKAVIKKLILERLMQNHVLNLCNKGEGA